MNQEIQSLNPYCSGQWSSTYSNTFGSSYDSCLNPCCNGQWSRTLTLTILSQPQRVLILVVMDNGLVHIKEQLIDPISNVLILVVMDNGLVHLGLNETESL